MANKTVNIDFRSPIPVETKLSNFNNYPFTMDGVYCGSMEGWIQSLKTNDVDEQYGVCALSGRVAKRASRKLPDWKSDGILYWKGEPYDRLSSEYLELVTRAYHTLCDANVEFQEWLVSTGDATLTHRVGSAVKSETVLTEREFCDILTEMRSRLHYSHQMEF